MPHHVVMSKLPAAGAPGPVIPADSRKPAKPAASRTRGRPTREEGEALRKSILDAELEIARLVAELGGAPLTPAEREEAFEKRWREGGFNYQYAFRDLMDSAAANELAADFVRRQEGRADKAVALEILLRGQREIGRV